MRVIDVAVASRGGLALGLSFTLDTLAPWSPHLSICYELAANPRLLDMRAGIAPAEIDVAQIRSNRSDGLELPPWHHSN